MGLCLNSLMRQELLHMMKMHSVENCILAMSP
jgi:hypothetical protein